MEEYIDLADRCQRYIERSSEVEPVDDELFDAWNELISLSLSDPYKAQQVIAATAERLNSPEHLAHLGAGPLENILHVLGEEAPIVLRRFDRHKLELLLQGAWRGGLPRSAKAWISSHFDFK
ncbi:MAG: hypothetical protein AAFQ81_02690 [Pseudomonadota bacterium]